MDITQLLAFGVEQGASDCHLSAGEPPMLRVHGDLKKLDGEPLSPEAVHGLIFDIMNDTQRKVQHHGFLLWESLHSPSRLTHDQTYRLSRQTQRR